jgi:ABC-type transport system substrate-binding protein
MEFRAGAVDVYAPQPHQIARFRTNDEYRAFSSLGTGYTYIGYNNRKPLFADQRVRRALGMAIDVDAIIDFVLYGEGERITGPYPKNTQWYDETVAPLPYDPERAEALLNEVGWRRNGDGLLEKDGRVFEFNLITNNGNPVRKAVATIVQNAWRQIGVKVNTQVFEWAVFLEDFINPAEFDAVILGWRMGPDPDLFQLWHSSQTGFAQLNAVGFRDPRADELMVRIRRTYDDARQRQYAHRLHARIAEEQPYTFLFTRLATQVLNRRIVMVLDDGSVAPIEAVNSGDLFYHFNRWRRLEHDLAP